MPYNQYDLSHHEALGFEIYIDGVRSSTLACQPILANLIHVEFSYP